MAREEPPNDWLRSLAYRAKHFTLTHPWLTSLIVVCLVSASGGAFWHGAATTDTGSPTAWH